MTRVKISEFQAKKLIYHELKQPYHALQVDQKIQAQTLKEFFGEQELVVKVDQGIKKRAQQGLVAIRNTPGVVERFVKAKSKQSYTQFIVEPFLEHEIDSEKYLSLERTRGGVKVLYSDKGGIAVETKWDQISSKVPPELEKSVEVLKQIFDQYYFSFLEINPLVLKKERIYLLDLAVEIDDAALSLTELGDLKIEPVKEWHLSKSEQSIQKLDTNTPASLKYRLVNANGSIWMLLSGGGASLVLADEVADLGYGKQLANYGEYSGNPTTEDTYLYTKVILNDLLRSRAAKKVLIIAGGVANFTDVVKTFQGVLQALNEFKKSLQEQGVKIFVRRGGPNQKKGLQLMRDFLEQNSLIGQVMGPERILTDIIKIAVEKL